MEFTCLTSEGGGDDSLLLAFIQMIDSMLASGRDFNLAHAYLALFLQVSQLAPVFYCEKVPVSFLMSLIVKWTTSCVFQLHLHTLSQDAVVMEALLRLSSRLETGWAELQASFNQSLCLLSYMKSALL